MTATMVLCGIISQVLHLTLLPSFPYFALTSPQFVLAAGKIVFIWSYSELSNKFQTRIILKWLILTPILYFSDGNSESLFGVSIFRRKLSSVFGGKSYAFFISLRNKYIKDMKFQKKF